MKNEFLHTSFILNNYISRIAQNIIKKHFNLSFNEYLILVLVWICWKHELWSIIKKTGLTPAAITILLKRMQDKWYLIIETQQQDSRKKSVKTTSYWNSLIEEIEGFIEEQMSKIFAEIDENIFRETHRNMKKITVLLYNNL